MNGQLDKNATSFAEPPVQLLCFRDLQLSNFKLGLLGLWQINQDQFADLQRLQGQ